MFKTLGFTNKIAVPTLKSIDYKAFYSHCKQSYLARTSVAVYFLVSSLYDYAVALLPC